MPDITLCVGKFCLVYDKCYRNQAKPSLNQSYGDFSVDDMGPEPMPIEIKRQKDCKFFMKLRENDVINSTYMKGDAKQ